MASILDVLFPALAGGSFTGAPPATPLPAPNPLRGPAQPSPGLGILESLLQPPSLSGGPGMAEAKRKKGEADARQRYQRTATGQGGAPTGSPRAAQAVPDEDGDGTPDAQSPAAEGEVPPVPSRAPGNDSGAVSGPDGSSRQLAASPQGGANPFQAALLQLGLNLMVPQWGGPMSQLGQALGGAAGAAGRAQASNDADAQKVQGDEDQAAKRGLVSAQTDKTKAETADIEAGTLTGESSRARRLKGKAPSAIDEVAAGAGLGPKGKLFLQQQVKTLNKFDPLVDEGDPDPAVRLQEMVDKAKTMDAPSAPVTPPKAPNVGGTETVQALPFVDSPALAKKLPPNTKFYYTDPKTKQLTIGTTPNG